MRTTRPVDEDFSMNDTTTSLELNDTQVEELKRTMKPLADAHTLPPWCYTSESFYRAEVRDIFMKEWLGVCRVDDIPNPGDYFCADIAQEPIVIVRDKQTTVRAFTRTCRHRGACVVEGRGNARFFRCPFHGWTYDLRGRLIAARQMDKTTGFDPGEWPLLALRVEIWQGVVFVNFDPDAEALTPRLTGASEALANYRLEELRASEQMPFWSQCNWKLTTEQAMDMYHVPDTHFMPKSSSRVAKNFVHEDSNDVWSLSYSPLERMHPYITATNQNKTDFPAISTLNDFELSTFNLLLIYPSTIIGVLPHGALTFFIWPEGIGRTKVTLDLWFTEEGFAMDNYPHALQAAQEGFITTNNQDMHSARITQRGMQSRQLAPGRFSFLEEATWELDRYVIRRVAGLI